MGYRVKAITLIKGDYSPKRRQVKEGEIVEKKGTTYKSVKPYCNKE